MTTRLAATRFARLAWMVLAWNLVVILWGAFVRASGSGAGCGAHWPLCNGVVVPRGARLETLIELSHRLSSGVALILGLWLLIAALRSFPPGHLARRAAMWSFGFLLGEAAIGAGLVLFRLVADNESTARALAMAAHLINTNFLLAALTCCALAGAVQPSEVWARRHLKVADRVAAAVLLGLVAVGVTGAIAALGDTLYPSSSLAEGLRQDLSRTAATLLRLRALHPFVAVAVAGCAWFWASRSHARLGSRWVTVLVPVQVLAGVVNVALLAPIWMQLVHLLLADLLWIAVVAGAFDLRWARQDRSRSPR